MRADLITCPPDTTLGQAAAMLAHHNVHALLVAEPGGAPLGVLSDIDLLAGEWLSGDDAGLTAMRAMTAGDLMTSPVASIDVDATAAEAAARMLGERVHRLVATQADQAVGVVSISDLVRGLAAPPAGRAAVADVMSRGIVVCRDDTRLDEAARAMTERRSRSVVVVSPRGKALGVVTGYDLLAAAAAGDAGQTVSAVMHAPLAIAPNASLQAAADMMLQRHVHRLLVTDPAFPDGLPLGIICTSDIFIAMGAPGSVWQ